MHHSFMPPSRADVPQAKVSLLLKSALLSLLLLFFLTACSTTEEIWLNADGTLRWEFRYDMSAMMSFANMMEQFGEDEEEEEEEWPMIADLPYDDLDDEDDAEEGYEGYEEAYEDELGYAEGYVDDLVGYEEEHEDELGYQGEFETDEVFADDYESDLVYEEGEGPSVQSDIDRLFEGLMSQDKIDTLISFRSLLAEVLREEGLEESQMWEELAADQGMSNANKMTAGMLMNMLFNLNFRIQSDKEEGIFMMSLIQDFDSFYAMTSTGDMLRMLLALSGESLEPAQAAMLPSLMTQKPTYSLNKKEFRLLRPAELENDENGMAEEDLDASILRAFMQHEYVIHFPGKVKKVNRKDAVIEGNTVRIAVPTDAEAASKPFELIVKYK